jgi:hypothetical protein
MFQRNSNAGGNRCACTSPISWPIGEGEIGGDQQRGVFVELADQVEQQLAARLAERQITPDR